MKIRPNEIQLAGEVVVGEIVEDDVIEFDALGDLLERARPWSAEPVRIPALVTVFLWLLMPLDLAVSAWLFEVLGGRLGCDGALCTLATLHDHPALTMGLAAGSSVVLLVTCVGTRAFTCGTAPVLVLISIAAAVAVASVLGAVLVAVLLALLILLLIAVAFAVLGAVVSR